MLAFLLFNYYADHACTKKAAERYKRLWCTLQPLGSSEVAGYPTFYVIVFNVPTVRTILFVNLAYQTHPLVLMILD